VVNSADEGQLLDVNEATFVAFERAYDELPDYVRYRRSEQNDFRSTVNRILDEHDLPFQVVENEVVPRGSMAMYANVVAPTISLLHRVQPDYKGNALTTVEGMRRYVEDGVEAKRYLAEQIPGVSSPQDS
jgi:hypothetical protein